MAGSFPERAPYPRLESKLDPYTDYLTQRWAAGETKGQQLWLELRGQGFTGSLMAVMRWAQRQQVPLPPPSTYMVLNHEPYRELGAIATDDRQKQQLVLRMQQRIERLGYVVSITPITAQAA